MNTIIPRAARLAQEWDNAVLRPYQNDRSLALANARTAKLDRRGLCCRGFMHASRAAKRTDSRFYAWFDSSGVPAVQRAHLEQAAQAKTWFDMGVPLNDILQATDAPFHDQAYGTVGYKPIGLEPYGADPLDGITDPSGAPTAPDGGAAPSESAVGGVWRVGGVKTSSATSKASEAVRRRLWAMWRKSWQPLERQMEGRVRKHFYVLRSQTLANFHRLADQLAPPEVEDAGKRTASVQAGRRKDVIGEVLFDISVADKKLVASVGPLYHEAYRLGGAQSMREAADAKGEAEARPFDIDEPEVRAKLRARTVGIKEVDATLRRRLAHKLAQSVEEGKTIEQMADALKAEFNFARTRAATIARTEVGAAVEEARHEGRKQGGVKFKAWLWSRKEHGRPGHAEAEARYLDHPIPNDEDFIVDGYSCPYPRASSLPVGEIVNCGCTCLSKFSAGESPKATLARYARSGFLTYDQLTRADAATMPHQSKEADDAPSED